jgi:hypothetical protein
MGGTADRVVPIVLLILGLACFNAADAHGQDAGYVDVLLATPVATDQPLYLGSTPLSGRGHFLLRLPVADLTLKGSAWFSETYCRIRVRRDRLTTVTVRFVYQRPRCECEIRAPDSTAAMTVCQ